MSYHFPCSIYKSPRSVNHNALPITHHIDGPSTRFRVRCGLLLRGRYTRRKMLHLYPPYLAVCISHCHKYYNVVASGRTRTLGCENIVELKASSQRLRAPPDVGRGRAFLSLQKRARIQEIAISCTETSHWPSAVRLQ